MRRWEKKEKNDKPYMVYVYILIPGELPGKPGREQRANEERTGIGRDEEKEE